MYSTLLLAAYCGLIVAGSLAGGWLPSLLKLTHLRLQLLMSLVSGVVLGVALLHLLPHAVAELHSLDLAVAFVLLGLLLTFFLVRFFHSHSHEVVEEFEHSTCEHDHEHHHAHGHDHGHAPGPTHGHPLNWIGLAIGLALHTLIDGIAVAADTQHAATWSLAGLGTFLAVFLHKPLDAMSITSLMAASGWPPARRHVVNGVFALMCPLGAALFWLGLSSFVEQQPLILGCALAFSAGVFLCISLSDLLPEVQFHHHDRWKLSAALLLGVALAYGIGLIEPAHSHEDSDHQRGHEAHEHDGDHEH